MSKQAQLILGADGKTAHIKFANGKESEIFDSKNHVLRSIPGMIVKEKITGEEADEISKAVMAAKDLPNRSESETGGLLDMLMEALGGAGVSVTVVEVSSRSSIHATFPEISSADDIKEPMFRMCVCGDNHGWLLFKDDKGEVRGSSRLDSKYEALKIVQTAQKKYGLSGEGADKLAAEIEASPLPKFADEKEEKQAKEEVM
ncbi:MAG: hypothetical protein KBC17_01390 [Candidatus Pacebacteria bacterium]|nr:hypothetical protein [Candidatus Paceibacterota bacterium]